MNHMQAYGTSTWFLMLLALIQIIIVFSIAILGIYTMILAIKALRIYIKNNS